MDDQNNLNELNKILFSTLRGVESGTIDEKKAQTVANLGNTIINNAKTQLQAYKLTGGRTGINALPPGEKGLNGKNIPKESYERQAEYAKERGFHSVAEAIGELGKREFLDRVKQWVKLNS